MVLITSIKKKTFVVLDDVETYHSITLIAISFTASHILRVLTPLLCRYSHKVFKFLEKNHIEI